MREALGFDARRPAESVAFHRDHASPWPRSRSRLDGRYIGTTSLGDRPERAAVIGPMRARGGPNGIVSRRGRVAAAWGDTPRPHLPCSIARSYLALLAGLAVDDGLVPPLDEPGGPSVVGPWFEGAHDAITWRHLLALSSEWSGARWGGPDPANATAPSERDDARGHAKDRASDPHEGRRPPRLRVAPLVTSPCQEAGHGVVSGGTHHATQAVR